MRNQNTAATSTPPLPKDFIPAESSVLKGYKYDAAKQELTTITNDGQTYTHSEVNPEEFKQFVANDSTGKAFNTIRANHVLTMKNGLPFKPVGSQSSLRKP